jgi:hypothetical protein
MAREREREEERRLEREEKEREKSIKGSSLAKKVRRHAGSWQAGWVVGKQLEKDFKLGTLTFICTK